MARHTDGMLLLVPCDPLRPRRPDEHFAAEAAADRDAAGLENADRTRMTSLKVRFRSGGTDLRGRWCW